MAGQPEKPAHVVFGGVEGGATCSKITLLNGNGIELGKAEGPGTNFWMIGMDETVNRISAMIHEVMKVARLKPKTTIKCMCLSLSGAEDDKVNKVLREKLLFELGTIVLDFVICSDTAGPIATASENGGVVLIAGTGSNCLLVNQDKSTIHCGGWGHILGDEGSAYWVSLKALKIHFDNDDRFMKPPNNFSTNTVWSTIQHHFKISDRYDLLPIIYKDFDKSKVARLCRELAEEAKVSGDPLCLWLFEEAGRMLARHLVVVYRLAEPAVVNQKGGMPVVCVGSVWNSFDLLRPGFYCELSNSPFVQEISLLRLNVTAAVGATYLAAEHTNFNLPRDYSNNFTIFYHYKTSSKPCSDD